MTKRNSRCKRAARARFFPASVLMLTLSGCALDVQESEDIATVEQSIENGQFRPSTMNGGTVRVYIFGWNGIQDCSGQVISRDSILTAAHCFTNSVAGIYEDGWAKEKSVDVLVTHQNSDGTWENVTTAGERVKVFIRKEFYDNLGNTSKRSGYDLAVLRRQNQLSNVVQSDVAGLAWRNADQVSGIYAYGHGYYQPYVLGDRGGPDIFYDDNQLRRGHMLNLTYYTSSASSRYRSIRNVYGPSDANLCEGDSGGPWKTYATSSSSPAISGIQFGVTSQTNPKVDGCGTEEAWAAMVNLNDDWIVPRVEEGRGTCTRYNYTVMQTMTMSAEVCW